MKEIDILVVLSTFPNAETAAGIGRILVDDALAACVNIVPGIRSIYAWNGEVRDETEVLMVMKTTAGRFPDLRERLLALHPYDVPEIVALNAAGGHHAYFDWVAAATRTPDA
jgi:periplasmic divalent cation tolerance protein